MRALRPSREFLLDALRSASASVALPAILAMLTLGFAAVSACSNQGTAPQAETTTSRAPDGQLTSAHLPLGADTPLAEVDSVADVVDVVLPSVVSVSSTRTRTMNSPFQQFFGQPPGRQEQQGLGSGVILSADGLVVTNNHVVEDADSLEVRTNDGREFDARVVGTDPKSDLAVLQLEGELGELRPIAIGDSSELRLGEVVLAVGNPFGVGQTVTLGIVSAKGRADMGIVDYEDFIQTDAAINPGNSGGALVNTKGQLVGINTAILSRSGGYMGIGFAIPTTMAVPIIEALRNDGRVSRGWLGVSIQELSQDLQTALELESGHGVLIADVQSGGPAAKAGLQGGDVVTSVDGSDVDSTGRFRNLIAGAGANAKVVLGVVRDGKKLRIEVGLGSLPEEGEEQPLASKKKPEGPGVEGLTLRTLDDELRQRLGAPREISGAVVTQVEPGSKAAQARLRPGDVILQIDRKPVTSADEAQKLYQAGEGARLLQVWRRGNKSFVVVK